MVKPPQERPNILVILSDDQGYADAGFQGSRDIPTPNLDRLAASGIRFTDAYVSHAYCSPSRAGLLTGRYQMRFGHERNPHGHEGLPVTETLLPQHLKQAGYATGWIGKWHLGTDPQFRPENRGFDDTFGFLGGGHNYQDWQPDPKSEYRWPILRNGKEEDVKEHLTLALGHEAASFITRHRGRPWFLYLAFNAPHMPNQPTPERLERFKHIADPLRRSYVAQVSLLDDAIGEALDALKQSGQIENTIVFFLSDNGGATYNGTDNSPLRGGKGMTYEGGARVPFVVSWPKVLPAGRDYVKPVSSLDIFATSLACAGIPMPTDKTYDGVDLIPFITGKDTTAPHPCLFWRLTEKGKRTWGVRMGAHKLTWVSREPAIFDCKYWCYSREATSKEAWLAHTPYEVYDLRNDIGEKTDISAQDLDLTRQLLGAIENWEKQGAPLAFNGGDGPDDGVHPKSSVVPTGSPQ